LAGFPKRLLEAIEKAVDTFVAWRQTHGIESGVEKVLELVFEERIARFTSYEHRHTSGHSEEVEAAHLLMPLYKNVPHGTCAVVEVVHESRRGDEPDGAALRTVRRSPPGICCLSDEIQHRDTTIVTHTTHPFHRLQAAKMLVTLPTNVA
jgi:hypothetical protein